MDSSERWLTEHGAREILRPDEIPEMQAAAYRVLLLLNDGHWHDAESIRRAAGQGGRPASEGTRRLRDLRAALRGLATIEKRRTNADSRLFEYRIVKEYVPDPEEPPQQGSLF